MKVLKVKLTGRGLDILMAMLAPAGKDHDDYKWAGSLLAEIEGPHKRIVRPVYDRQKEKPGGFDELDRETCEVVLDNHTREWTLKKLGTPFGLPMTLSIHLMQLEDALKNPEELEVKPKKG